MKVRSFIAVELGEKEKRSLEHIQNKLKRELPAVRWVKPNTMHLTLKFLGYIEESRIAQVKESIDAAVKNCRSFQMRLSGIGAFPNVRNPRRERNP
jgi:2'-5' RNA ligase